ncbi:hypothetical protein PTI98_001033 [Pleurotus ostreatus]|nr:hypothetical protein PTI98_001033 [Pleurotus ostreatus]
MAITLPENFEYVTAGLVSTVWVLLYQTMTVSKHRKAAGVKYPQAYADKAEAEASLAAKKFNCAQRAHQNTLENIPPLYVSALITALKYPIPAAVGLGLWSVSRIAYTAGYTSGDPAKVSISKSATTSLLLTDSLEEHPRSLARLAVYFR